MCSQRDFKQLNRLLFIEFDRFRRPYCCRLSFTFSECPKVSSRGRYSLSMTAVISVICVRCDSITPGVCSMKLQAK